LSNCPIISQVNQSGAFSRGTHALSVRNRILTPP
jgi:hypothetical protein